MPLCPSSLLYICGTGDGISFNLNAKQDQNKLSMRIIYVNIDQKAYMYSAQSLCTLHPANMHSLC